jgi:hypothetical protein
MEVCPNLASTKSEAVDVLAELQNRNEPQCHDELEVF